MEKITCSIREVPCDRWPAGVRGSLAQQEPRENNRLKKHQRCINAVGFELPKAAIYAASWKLFITTFNRSTVTLRKVICMCGGFPEDANTHNILGVSRTHNLCVRIPHGCVCTLMV